LTDSRLHLHQPLEDRTEYTIVPSIDTSSGVKGVPVLPVDVFSEAAWGGRIRVLMVSTAHGARIFGRLRGVNFGYLLLEEVRGGEARAVHMESLERL
jgi:hypothetical protein